MSIEGVEQEPVTLLRSQFECPKCHDLIASIHRHDFNSCKCGATSIDGGLDYLRLAGDWIFGAVPEDFEKYSHAITIAGPHTKASKIMALEIYKGLWSASGRGEQAATTSEVVGEVMRRGHAYTNKAIIVYLDLFVQAECVSKQRRGPGYLWFPMVPLVERSDAP